MYVYIEAHLPIPVNNLHIPSLAIIQSSFVLLNISTTTNYYYHYHLPNIMRVPTPPGPHLSPASIPYPSRQATPLPPPPPPPSIQAAPFRAKDMSLMPTRHDYDQIKITPGQANLFLDDGFDMSTEDGMVIVSLSQFAGNLGLTVHDEKIGTLGRCLAIDWLKLVKGLATPDSVIEEHMVGLLNEEVRVTRGTVSVVGVLSGFQWLPYETRDFQFQLHEQVSPSETKIGVHFISWEKVANGEIQFCKSGSDETVGNAF